jgi:hypothetical protein
VDGEHQRNVHGRWKGVIGRLPSIHMVVGMHWLLRAPLFLSEHFVGNVGDDLVDIHVRLRPASGLVNHEREMLLVFAVLDFAGSSDDSIDSRTCYLRFQRLAIRSRACHLLYAECLDQLTWHLVRINADLKVLHRAGGLGTPIRPVWHLDLAHCVALCPIGHVIAVAISSASQADCCDKRNHHHKRHDRLASF